MKSSVHIKLTSSFPPLFLLAIKHKGWLTPTFFYLLFPSFQFHCLFSLFICEYPYVVRTIRYFFFIYIQCRTNSLLDLIWNKFPKWFYQTSPLTSRCKYSSHEIGMSKKVHPNTSFRSISYFVVRHQYLIILKDIEQFSQHISHEARNFWFHWKSPEGDSRSFLWQLLRIKDKINV